MPPMVEGEQFRNHAVWWLEPGPNSRADAMIPLGNYWEEVAPVSGM